MGRGRKTGVEGVHIVKKPRAGQPVRWYIYAWRGGPCIRTQDGGDKPKITTTDITAIGNALQDRSPVPKDTMAALIADYRTDAKNPEWARLEPNTRRLWNNCLDHILTRWGTVPLRLWNDSRQVAKVMAWRAEMAKTPRYADEHIANLSRLLRYGKRHFNLKLNVAEDIPHLYRGGNRAEIIWTDEDVSKFLASAKTPMCDVVKLVSMTGLRRTDLAKLKLSEVGTFVLSRVALKKSKGKRRKVTMPIIPGLKDLLDELSTRPRKTGVDTVLVNSRGESWTELGMSSSFTDARNEADISYINDDGVKQWKRLHDLRGTFATKLMTIPGARLTDAEIAELMAWSVQQVSEIRRRYVDGAAIVVALGKRLANTDVNSSVN